MKVDFGRTAEDYSRHRAGFPEKLFKRLADFGLGKEGQVVLDLATGTGALARGLVRRGASVTGLDISAEMLAAAASLAKAEGLTVGRDPEKPRASASAVIGETEIFVPLEGVVDVEAERARLEKEALRIRKALTGLEKKLADERFRAKAPPHIVAQEEERLAAARSRLEGLHKRLAELGQGQRE